MKPGWGRTASGQQHARCEGQGWKLSANGGSHLEGKRPGLQGRLSIIYRGSAVPDTMLNALYTSSRTCQEGRNFHVPVLSEAQTLNDLLKAEIAFRVEMAQLQKPALPFTPVTALDPVEPPELPKNP